MKLYLEFDGAILDQTESFNFMELQSNILKVVSECVVRLKKTHKKNLSAAEENLLKDRILSKLRIVKSKSKWGAIKVC